MKRFQAGPLHGIIRELEQAAELCGAKNLARCIAGIHWAMHAGKLSKLADYITKLVEREQAKDLRDAGFNVVNLRDFPEQTGNPNCN